MANTQLVARVRIVIDVPFEADIDEPDETGHSHSRVVAGKHAEKKVMDWVKAIVANHGEIVKDLCVVEEVREA